MRCKIVGTVVNANKQLIKLVVKDSDTGRIDGLPISELIKTGFDNDQFKITPSGVEELGSFKLNNVAMALDIGNNEVKMIKNDIMVTKRFYDENGNYLGVEVRYAAGGKDAITLKQLSNMQLYFKPYNFIIKKNENGSLFLTGKDGVCKLDDIEKVVIRNNKTERKTKEHATTKIVNNEEKVRTLDIDILDIFDFVDAVNGRILKLPSEIYKTENKNSKVVYGSSFRPYYGIEIATSKLIFPDSKVNVSMNFKRPGYVMVDGVGKVDTYTYSSKKIFNNGESTMEKLGVIIPSDSSDRLLEMREHGLKVRSIEVSEDVQGVFKGIIENKKYSIYEIDTKSICLMTKEKQEKSILSIPDICNNCCGYYELKTFSKIAGPRGYLMKLFKEEAGDKWFKDVCKKEIAYNLREYNDEQLKAIKEAGIDIYSGSYTKLVGDTELHNDAVESKKSSSDDITIDYTFCGLDASSLTGKDIYNSALANDTETLSKDMIKLVLLIRAEKTVKDRYELTKKLSDKAANNINRINKTLWMHRAAMFIEGNKTNVHVQDRKDWELDKRNRSKKYDVYDYIGNKDVDLKIRLSGVAI